MKLLLPPDAKGLPKARPDSTKKWVTYFCICILSLDFYFASAQKNTTDSLLHVLKIAVEDTSKVNTLNSLSRLKASIGNYDLAIQYAQQALQLSEKILYKKGIATAYNNIGIVYWNKGNFDKALDVDFKSLKIRQETGDKRGIANSYNNIGLIYWNQGNYEMALDNLLKSQKIWEEIKDKNGLGMSFLNIGNIYLDQGNFDKALEFYSKSLQINIETGNKSLEATNLNNIGIIYENKNSLEKALVNHLKALKIREEIKDRKGIAMSYNNIGLIYYEQSNYEKALDNQLKSQKINKEIGDKQGAAVSFNNIGNIYAKQKKFDDAFHYINMSLDICKSIGFKAGMKDSYSSLVDLYEKKGDYKHAFEYDKLFSNLKDSLLNEQTSKQITEMNTKYGSEKKDKDLILKDAEISQQRADAEKQIIQRNAFVIGFALVLMLIFFVYRGYRQKKIANGQLESMNKDLEKLSIVASETDNGVLICGPNGEIEWSNAGLTRLLGYTFEEMKQRGNTIEELSSNPDIKLLIHQSIESKKTSIYEVLNTTKDGSKRWTQSTLTPIFDDSGNIKKLVIIDSDISDRKKIEEKLSEQNLELEQSHKDISILSEIGKEITSSLSVEKIIEKTYENVNRLMEASVFFIGIYDAKKNQLFFPGAMEKGIKFPAISYDLDDKSRPAIWCFENQKEIIMNNLLQEYTVYFPNTPVPKPVIGETPESLVYFPLSIQNKKIGVISVQSFNKNAYNNYHISIIRNLAVYVAIAIENAQVYESLEEKVEERTAELVKKKGEIEKTYSNIQVLSEIGQEITSTLDIDKVLDTVYEKVNSMMDATEFGIGLYNHEKQSIDFSNYYFESKRMSSDLDTWVSMADKNRLSVWCAENKKAVFINDMQTEYVKYISNLDSYLGEGKLLLESLICLPLIVEKKFVGLISVQSSSKNAYTQNHLEILQTLASYIAIALDNARLYDNMEGEVNARTAEIEKQKIILEDKNLKITDSINYAQRIQQAILPSQEMINGILPNSFIFFKPKDIVSGDFYWAHAINKSEILFAAVDCTGHGVPGAFMSIMGYNLLEQIVKENKIYQPALILTELSKLVVNSLKQTDAIGSVKEGMDIALCKIDYKNLELEYAGAHNSLNLIRNGVLSETKADQRSIGISITSAVQFHNHKIKLEKGDCIYIFSDGYADQFGGKLNQKFFYQTFRELLVNIHQLSMEKQQKKLEKVISEWKGEREQTDDMLVIGVRI